VQLVKCLWIVVAAVLPFRLVSNTGIKIGETIFIHINVILNEFWN